MHRRLALASLALLVTAASSWAAAASPAHAAPPEQKLTPVIQSVLSPPRWYRVADGRFQLSYELELTNAVPVPATVTSIAVLRGNGGRIESLRGDRLERSLTLDELH